MTPSKRIFVSYSHDSDEHRRLVRQLVDSLKENGFDVAFDQYLNEDPPEGWPLWMQKEIKFANKVLLVCTETYLRRVEKDEVAGKGRGVCWEANLIYAELYESQTKSNKFIPVILRESDREFVPMPLGANSVFTVEDGESFEKLFRYLTGQTNHAVPQTGNIPHLPAPKPLPTFKLKSASDSLLTSGITTPPTVLSPTPNHVFRSLKPNIPPQSRFELRQLDWYEEADADFFRGREADVKSLRSLLLDQPVVRLFGSSGVGKSSILRAGLMRELRRHGFRSVVVRPFKNPQEAIPQQISEQLLRPDSPKLSSTLSLESLHAELGPAFAAEQCPYLFVLIDQVEDVVSPLVPFETRERLVTFLQQVWSAGATQRPLIRVVVAYRTDADAQLGPLWQEVSGTSMGLPYHVVQGLTRDAAQRVLTDVLSHSHKPTTSSVNDLIDELVRESLSLDASGEVFPPYLQMIIAQHADLAASSATTNSDNSNHSAVKISSAADLIGTYMRSRLSQLESRGGDFAKCSEILNALSRSNGSKLTLTLGEIAAEIRLSPDTVQPMINALIASRLIRPIADSYEIQHDRLAQTVIASLSDSEREFKSARELLTAKAVSHARTGAWLDAKECLLLYRHHARIQPNRIELRFLLGSLLVADTVDHAAGWLFIQRAKSPTAFYRELANNDDWRVRKAIVRAFAPPHDHHELVLLQKLARDKVPEIRLAAALAISTLQKPEALPILRELARSDDWAIRHAVIPSIARFSDTSDLPLLQELCNDGDGDVRQAAAEAIETISTTSLSTSLLPTPAPLISEHSSPAYLRELIRCDDPSVRADAICCLAAYGSTDDYPLFRKLLRDDNLDAAISFAILTTLARSDRETDIRYLCTFDVHSRIVEISDATNANDTLSIFRMPDHHRVLRKLATSWDFDVRLAALQILAQHRLPQDLLLFRATVAEDELQARVCAINAVISYRNPTDLPLLRELALSDAPEYEIYKHDVITAIGEFCRADDRAIFRSIIESAEDADSVVAAIHALARQNLEEDIPFILSAGREWQWLESDAINAIASYSRQEHLPYLRDLASDTTAAVRLKTLTAIREHLNPQHREIAMSLVDDKSAAVRAMALEILCRFAQPSEMKSILENRIHDESETVRVVLATEMKKVESEEILSLLREFAYDPAVSVRLTAAQTLASFRSVNALEILRIFSSDSNVDVRLAAVSGFGNYTCEEVISYLDSLLSDTAARVRLATARILSLQENKNVIVSLGRALADYDGDVRHIALQGISKFREKDVVPVLSDFVYHSDQKMRMGAVKFISQHFSNGNLCLLRDVVRNDADFDVSQTAVLGIVESEDVDAEEILRQLVCDRSFEVRHQTVDAILARKPQDAVVQWFLKHTEDMPIDVVAKLDLRLFGPAWLR